MARLGLKNYQNPQFAIPNIAPDQRPLNQLAKFAQWLHSVYDWRVNDDEEGGEESSESSETPEESAPAEASGNSEDIVLSYDPASATAEEAFQAGEKADPNGSYADSMTQAYENAKKAKSDKLRSMVNASAVGSSGEPTGEVQDFVGFTGKDRDSVGGPKTQKALWSKLYDDEGTGDESLTRVYPQYQGWWIDEFDPATIGR